MKKFNSILAIAAVALTSVLGFTSCDKNDDSIGQPTVPPTDTVDKTPTDTGGEKQTQSTYEYQYFVSDNVLDLGDFEFTVVRDGQTTIQKASEGQTAVESYSNADYDNPKTYQLTGRRLIINNIKAGDNVTVKFVPNEAAISALPADGTMTYAILRDITLNSENYKNSDFGKCELPNGEFMQMMNKVVNLAGYNFK